MCLHFTYHCDRSRFCNQMHSWVYRTLVLIIVNIFKFLLKIFISSVSNRACSTCKFHSVVDGFSSMLRSPRLQLVCLSRGLVGYWKGYFNHKRCRRRDVNSQVLDGMNFCISKKT